MSATWVLLFFCRDGSLPFMTRLPKKRGITQDGEDKSLILRQNVGNPPEVTSYGRADQVQFLAVPKALSGI